MKDFIAIIPTYGRPGFLAVTLELIARATGYQQFYYVFALDHGHHTGIPEVIESSAEAYNLNYEIIEPPVRYSKPGKQSFNVINAYRHAVNNLNPLWVHLIEEDIFIAEDFFEWHLAVRLDDITIPVSIGTKNNNSDDPVTDDPGAYYLKRGDYQSLGVCWHSEALRWALQYIDDSYFSDPVGYCAANFPRSKVGKFYAEQDGLFRRILEKYNMPVAFPHVPRAYHAGFHGFNRLSNVSFPADIEEQIKLIKSIAFNREKMKEVAKKPEHYYDSIPVDLKDKEWSEQKLVPVT